MKKAVFLTISILYSLTGLCQQITLSDVGNIDLPKGAEKITKEQAIDHVVKNLITIKLF